MNMEEWRLCVSDFERTVKFWTEEIMPSNVFSLREINTFNAQVLEIKNFIRTRNQNQRQCPVTLHKLHKMINDFNILLEKLAPKYYFILFFRLLYDFLVISRKILLLMAILKLSIIFLTIIKQ
jgi:hypothetical protein